MFRSKNGVTNNIINYYCQVNEDVIECHTVNV